MHLLNVSEIGIVQPFQVLSFDVEGVEFVFVNAAASYLVKLVELSLKQDEVTSLGRVLIEHALLEFLKGVNDLEEVAMAKEEIVVTQLTLLYTTLLNKRLIRIIVSTGKRSASSLKYLFNESFWYPWSLSQI